MTRLPPPRRPLKVLYLTHGARLSGAELALVRLLEALGGRVEAHVLLAEDGPLVDPLRRAGAHVSVRLLAQGVRELSRNEVRISTVALSAAGATIGYATSLERHLRRLRPDVVHIGSLKAGVYGAAAARVAAVPILWHIHDRIASDYLPTGAARALRLLIAALPNAVVANSRATMATLRFSSNSRQLTQVIPYPVPPVPVLRRELNGPLRIGMVGRFTQWKGQHVVVEAFANAFPDGRERLVLVGSAMFGGTEARYAEGLRELAHGLGVAERVEFRGFRKDVTAELATFDVLIHGSVIPEPFGQVIAEGMAAGLPVIAAGAGGATEIVSHMRTGMLYPPGDASALTQAMRQLAADPELRDRLGTAGRERVAEYAPERIADRFMAVYRAVLEATGHLSDSRWAGPLP